MCWRTTSSSTCSDLPMHPVFSSRRWTFLILDDQCQHFHNLRKTRMRLRWRQRDRASTLSPSTLWTEVQTLTVSSPSDPSLPSSSIPSKISPLILFNILTESLMMAPWLLEMAFSQVSQYQTLRIIEKQNFGFVSLTKQYH